MITHTVVKNKTGPKTFLLKEKEAYIVATSEIDGAHKLPRDTTSLKNELQQVLHEVGKRGIGNLTKEKITQRYDRRVIKWINREEGKGKVQKLKPGQV